MRIFFMCMLFFVAQLCAAQSSQAQPLPPSVNSTYTEMNPIISVDGQILYFSRIGHPGNMGANSPSDIWLSYKKPNNLWSKAINMGAPINSLNADFVIGLSTAQQTLSILRPQEAALYQSSKNGRVWYTPQAQQIDTHSDFSQESQFHFSNDGRILFLLLPAPDDDSHNDLYVSIRQDDNFWSTPIHCGEVLNSDKEEHSAFLAADGRSLYFSSNRSGGEGGFDLYMSRREDNSWNNWSTPINLGVEINSSDNEYGISIPAKGTPAYFVRKEEGNANIYTAPIKEQYQPEAVVLLKGTVAPQSGNKVLPSTLQLQSLEDNSQLAKLEVDADGHYQLIIPYGQNVDISTNVKGYYPISSPVELSGNPIEELDEENNYWLTNTNTTAAYEKRNEEIINLQQHLRTLDEEMIALKAIRGEYLEKARKEDNTILDQSELSDPELDALRHRYQQNLLIAEERKDTIPIPSDYSQEKITKGDIKDMKTRFMRFYEYEMDKEDTEQQEEVEKGYVWELPENEYEAIKSEVVGELENNMKASVENELSTALIPEVLKEVSKELSAEENKYLEIETADLQKQLSTSFYTAPAAAEWSIKGIDTEADWERKLKKDLRVGLKDNVVDGLRNELEPKVKKRLKTDIVYLAKKEARKDVQKDLSKKLDQQLSLEAQLNTAALRKEEIVKPLIPPAEEKANSSNIYQEIEQNVILIPAQLGALVELQGVAFEPNNVQFTTTSYVELSRVLAFLQQNMDLQVEIGVHTAGHLSHTTAQHLSTRRAEQVVNFLISNGIEAKRLIAHGYGKSLPIADNDTPQGKKLNQRVEMRVVGKL